MQFRLQNSGETFLIIVKNMRAAKKTFHGDSKEVNTRNYLYGLAGINNGLDIEKSPQNRQVQLELSVPELEAIQKNKVISAPSGISRFYVVTYEIDKSSKMIEGIHLTLPDQAKMQLNEVADLTSLIERSQIEVTSKELEVVQGDKVPESIYSEHTAFGYGVASKQDKTQQEH
ncbi:hypothetical protein [Lentilactobacillus otakiensis]|uniref:hypothetical protein n=1 Tax=Lentilactobacillus otakiensis TaxID=481720 RepID=UPI003D17BC53